MSLCDWRRCRNAKLNEWDRQADKIKKTHFMSVHKLKRGADKDCWAENLKTTRHDCTLLSSTSLNGWPQCQTYLILFPLLYLLLEVGLTQVNLCLHVLQQVKQVLPQWEESCGSFGTGDGQRQENEVLHSHKMSERLHIYTQTCIALNTDLFTLKYW